MAVNASSLQSTVGVQRVFSYPVLMLRIRNKDETGWPLKQCVCCSSLSRWICTSVILYTAYFGNMKISRYNLHRHSVIDKLSCSFSEVVMLASLLCLNHGISPVCMLPFRRCLAKHHHHHHLYLPKVSSNND